jgi:hypothetical protein
MIIRNIAASDLDFAASLTTNEGWDSETRLELEGLFTHDPGGCLIAEIDGQRAGMCMATGYASFAFVGELIVVPDLRLRGLRAIYLDGVLAAVPLYERLGFKRVCRSWRFSGALCTDERTAQPPGVFPMLAADLDSVAQLDRTAFGADRRFFLERRLRLFP